LAQLSSASARVLVEGSSPFVQQDQPEMVVEAIRQVVEAARQTH
jgi:hypothetical protein